MTNAQKWVAAFLVLFILLFALSKLTKKENNEYAGSDSYGESSDENASAEPDGMALITRLGCISCHGSDLNGTGVGPSLVQVKDHWKRDALINYLRNPSSYSGDARFEAYKAKYNNISMPSYSNIDVKELGKIADYLLKQ